MATKKQLQTALLLFTLKAAGISAGWYYISEVLKLMVEAKNYEMVAFYSGIFAVGILVLLIMFRWSGFLSRVFAGLIALGGSLSILVVHLIKGPIVPMFVAIYGGISFLTLIIGYFILFKKIKV